MKGLLYGSTISIAFTLAACSEAKFSNVDTSSQKAENIEDEIAVVEVPEEQMDEVIAEYECGSIKESTCHHHDSQNQEQANAKKALVCHITANGKGVEICISKNALKAHIGKHGVDGGEHDYFGECH